MGIIDLIYPRVCVGCRREGQYICAECRKKVTRVGESLGYTGLVRQIIKEIKYRGTFDMVEELIEVWQPRWDEDFRGAVLTGVPMWQWKKRGRGYNQAELIAKGLGKRWKLQYRELLRRIRETKPMYGLNRQERERNVAGAFGFKKGEEVPAKVLLVDDVWTTGSTIKECRKTLIRAGVKEVKGVVLAR